MGREINIEPRKDIIKIHHKPYYSRAADIYMSGGRSSGKSYTIPEILVNNMIMYKGYNAACGRFNQNTSWNSQLIMIKKCLIRKGFLEGIDFECKRSRLEIVMLIPGRQRQVFFGSGFDDVNKLKSRVPEVGYVGGLWIEELQEFKSVSNIEDIEEVVVTFNRALAENGVEFNFQTYYTYNPPFNDKHPVNVHVNNLKQLNDPDMAFFHSTYLDVIDNVTGKPLNAQAFLKKVEQTKRRDYDLFINRYLGKPSRSNLAVYNMNNFQLMPEIPHGEYIKNYQLSIDPGYQVSATTALIIGITNENNIVVLDTFYYSPDKNIRKRVDKAAWEHIVIADNEDSKMTVGELVEHIYLFEQNFKTETQFTRLEILVDSADGAMKPEIYKKWGVRPKAAKKLDKEKMTEQVRLAAVERNIYVINKPTNRIFMFEHEKYKKEEKAYERGEFKVEKTDDHTCDAMQYFVARNFKALGLKY